MLRILFCSIFIFLSGIHLKGNVISEDPFSKALYLYGKGEYFHASIEFERAVFYQTDLVKIAYSQYYKSLCYKNMGQTERALDQLQSINVFKLPDTLFFKIKYEQALNNFLSGNHTQSIWNINDIKSRINDSLLLIQIVPLNILCLNADRNWEEAGRLLRYLIKVSTADSVKRAEVLREADSQYLKRNLPEFRSEKKAETLSRFVPGSGQIYCGKVFEGSFNFLMNASLLGFSLYEFYTKYYFAGYVAGLTLFNKTYHGGMHRASYLAREKNNESISGFNMETLDLLSKIYEGSENHNIPAVIK